MKDLKVKNKAGLVFSRTRLLHLQLDCWVFILLPLEPQRLSLPLSLARVFLDLLLSLPVDPQQTGAEDVVKTEEGVPVVVHEEQAVCVV